MKIWFKIALLAMLVATGNFGCKKEKKTLPVLTTKSATEITHTSAVSGGNISDNGGVPLIARGVCWNTQPDPATNHNVTNDGTETGSYSSPIASLNPGTLYYVRAYATNEVGTAYGNEITFTTSPVTGAIVNTAEVTSINRTAAVSGGIITSDGGGQVTARGVCWAASANPTVTNFKTEDGQGTGTFTSDLSDLTPGTKYYVRAYATNSSGTSYGDERSFTTIAEPPPLTAGLVAYYPFDGNADDASGNGNHGEVYGATLTTDREGNPDKAYSFNGTGNYIKVKDSPSLDITDEITITAWRYLTINSLGRLVRKINTWGFPVGGYILSAAGDYMNSELQLETHPNAVVITRIERTFPLNTWGFAAMTYDGNIVSLFFNGEKIFSEPATGKININNVDLLIGASEGVEYFGGKIDEIRIYNRALTENEILSLYSGR